MQPLTQVKVSLTNVFVRLVHTLDDMFSRPAVLVHYAGETVSMDLLIKHDYKLYHAARINITWTDTKKALLDICPPDSTTVDLFQWTNGVKTVDVHNSHSLVAVQLTPEKPLDIELEN